jgi:uncharacterized membrane protein (DUF4010 family)
MYPDIVLNLLLALALGLLVGLQREWSKSEIAGIRTFPLITILGALSGILADKVGGWTVAVALLAVAAMLVIGNLAGLRAGLADPGLTTEAAVLVMFAVGVAVSQGLVGPAIVVTGGVAVLLQWKRELHTLVARIDEAELRAVSRLVLIGLVILPALPNRDFGPYGVLNPFEVWLMVVLIVGISLAAYVTYRLFGARVGVLLTGLLGGLISSTATTMTYSQKARSEAGHTAVAGAVIVLSSASVFGRVLLEVAAVAPAVLPKVAPPLLAMTGVMAFLAWTALARCRREPPPTLEQQPPSTLSSAIVFGLLYAVVLLAVAAARQYFGQAALYAVAALSGLTDMDAITLSTSRLIESATLEAATGWRIILIGALANLGFKGGIVFAVSGGKLSRWVLPYFGVALAVGMLLLLLWPASHL